MVLNKDFREFVQLLNANDVQYLIVGGYAVGFHGYPRYTKDLDIWVWVDKSNAEKLLKTLQQFGFGSIGLTADDFLEEGEFIQLGHPPNRIDILTSCEGLVFEDCYKKREQIDVGGLMVNFIDIKSLLHNKKTVGRPQDLADISNLQPPSDTNE